MFVKLILPALLEAKDLGFRPIKYALFPPLGLATLERGQAVYAPPDGQRAADLNPAGAEVPT